MHPCTWHLSTWARPITAWHSYSSTRTCIIIMIALTSDETPWQGWISPWKVQPVRETGLPHQSKSSVQRTSQPPKESSIMSVPACTTWWDRMAALQGALHPHLSDTFHRSHMWQNGTTIPSKEAWCWRFLCSSTSAHDCQCSTSLGVFSKYCICLIPKEEATLSCLRLRLV
jgi:hypothetical protein